MPLPKPEPGLVLCYEFLWSHEAEASEHWGKKRRPCVIVLAVKAERGQVRVTVAPLTHLKPRNEKIAVEVPPKVKQHLGLDNDQSWIICDELNEFVWPGYDLYPVPGGKSDQYDYGLIPPLLYEQVRQLILALDEEQKRSTNRD
jgi:mRNA-degrading endonuclease toxin of MazEF toxin-antitoxin module